MRSTTFTLAVLAVLAVAAPALGQSAAADAESAGAAQEAPRTNRFDLQLLGGMSTYLDSPHASAGGLAHLHFGGFGLLGVGAWGTGADYESMLYGGGLSRRLFSAGALSVSAFGGYGLYSEVGATNVERDASGVLFGGIAALDFEPFMLSLTVSDLFGEYDGPDVPEAFTFHVPRVFFGIGF